MTHTPGPWEHIGDTEDDDCRVRQTDSVRMGVGFYSEKTICEGVSSEENGRLIAAAPELLSSCSEMLNMLEQMSLPAGFALDRARAAIAKATGAA